MKKCEKKNARKLEKACKNSSYIHKMLRLCRAALCVLAACLQHFFIQLENQISIFRFIYVLCGMCSGLTNEAFGSMRQSTSEQHASAVYKSN